MNVILHIARINQYKMSSSPFDSKLRRKNVIVPYIALFEFQNDMMKISMDIDIMKMTVMFSVKSQVIKRNLSIIPSFCILI